MPVERTRILNALFRDTNEPVIISDTDRVIRDVNGAFEKVFGYSKTDVVGTPEPSLYVDRRHEKLVADDFLAVADQTNSKVVWLSYELADSTVLNTRTTLIKVRNEGGATVGHAAVIHVLPEALKDILNQELMLEDLLTERQFFKALYRRTPAMMHSIDKNGVIKNVSDAWLKRLGYSVNEVIGRRSTEFLTDASAEFAKTILSDFWRTGSCERVPYTFVTKSGLPVEIELSAILDTTEGTLSTMAILEEVTDRNRAIRLLEDRNDDLRDFARVAAHDLQAPLRHISVFSKMIEDDLDRNDLEDARENARLIQTSVARLTGMVRGLLEFSIAAESGLNVTAVDLDVLMKRILASLDEHIASVNAKVTVDPLSTIACDEVLIERVFSNLITNAIKYVGSETTPEVHIAVERQHADLVFSVSDNGIGIPPEFHERIFQPLKRLHGPDSDFPGSGIGLALCRKIVEAHFGHIWVEQRREGGSIFYLKLPDLPAVEESDLVEAYAEITSR